MDSLEFRQIIPYLLSFMGSEDYCALQKTSKIFHVETPKQVLQRKEEHINSVYFSHKFTIDRSTRLNHANSILRSLSDDFVHTFKLYELYKSYGDAQMESARILMEGLRKDVDYVERLRNRLLLGPETNTFDIMYDGNIV
jgi:hypothetical protein